jgi:hypothetical protein
MSTPGGREMFQAALKSELLDEEKSGWYHTVIAKLLYLAKRARPDILTVVSFLCTRVTQPTKDGMHKLLHLLGYLHGTKEKVLIFNK